MGAPIQPLEQWSALRLDLTPGLAGFEGAALRLVLVVAAWVPLLDPWSPPFVYGIPPCLVALPGGRAASWGSQPHSQHKDP